MRAFRAKAIDIGRQRANQLRQRLGTEIRLARMAAGLTQRQLAARAGVSQQLVSLVERGLVPPSIPTASRMAAACGHELSIRLSPIASVPLRDSGQLALLQPIVEVASPAYRPRLEMPVAPGDPRAADLVLEGAEEILHVEAERAIVDLQAQLRPAQVKRGILAARYEPVRLIIALPDTRRIRAILRATLHSWPGASRCRLASSGGPFGKEPHLEAMEFFSWPAYQLPQPLKGATSTTDGNLGE